MSGISGEFRASYWGSRYVISPQRWRQGQQSQVSKSRALGKLSAEYTWDISLSHLIWLPCLGEICSEQEPIFFPITAAVPVKWPICLSRRTGHARLVGAICTMGEDKEGGVCIDVDAPSSGMESAVKFTNARDCRDAGGLCFFQLGSRSSQVQFLPLRSLLKMNE